MLCIPRFSEVGKKYPIKKKKGASKPRSEFHFFFLFFSSKVNFEKQRKFKNQCPLGGEWPDAVPCDKHGSILIPEFLRLVEFFVERGYPPIIVMNLGTTFTVRSEY